MLRDLNVSSKTMNQNLENAYAIAFGLGHCEQTAGRQCSSIARDQSASVTFRKRMAHPLSWRRTHNADPAAATGRGSQWVARSARKDETTGSRWLAWFSRQFKDGGSAVAANEFLG
jgi:hypothetical protein